MSNQWFRMYVEVLNDPKVQNLPPDLFKAWVNILCIACNNNGTLPETLQETAFSLRMSEIDAESVINRLIIAGLLDKVKGGGIGYRIAPHGWSKRQYKSDSSSERVKRYRQQHKTVTVTPPEQNRTDTERKKDSEDKSSGESAPIDFKKIIFNEGLKFLSESTGKPPDKLRPIIGKWCKSNGDTATATAIMDAQKFQAIDPISFIEKKLKGIKNDAKSNGKPTWGTEGKRLAAKYLEDAEREEQSAADNLAGTSLCAPEAIRQDSGGT